jgi:hypothetical protein
VGNFRDFKAHIQESSDVIAQRLVFPVPYSHEVVLVPRLLAGGDEIVDKCLAKFFLGVERVLGQAKEPLMTSLVEDNWKVVSHDVLISCS